MKSENWKPSATVTKALDELYEWGEKSGREMLIVLRDDKEVFRAKGNQDGVAMPADGVFLPGDTFLHNHPGVLNSFSNVDLSSAGFHDGHAYLVTMDNSRYYAHMRDMNSWFDAERPIWVRIGKVAAPVFNELNKGHYNGLTQDDQGVISPAHWVNLWLKNHGIIDYEYSLALPSEIASLAVSLFGEELIAKTKLNNK